MALAVSDSRPRTIRLMAQHADYVLAISAGVVACLGVVFVYSATRHNTQLLGNDTTYYLKRQAMFVAAGAVAMVVMAAVDYRRLAKLSGLVYVLMVGSLGSMFVVGTSSLGATRWLQLGPVQVQPSAFASLGLIIVVSSYCSRRSAGLTGRDLAKILVLAALPILMVWKQPDLGSALVMSIVLLVMLVVAGLPNRYLLLLFVLAAGGVFAILHFHVLQAYQLQRLTSFLPSHSHQVTPTIYTLNQSQAAIGAGGMWGTGLFHGAQTNLNYVPEQWTDFIFTAVGEQTGFVGSVAVLFLLSMVVWRVYRAAQTARDELGRLIASGVLALLAFSIFENVGMTMKIMPVAGIPLPFMSYGGSSIVAMFAAVGMALSVHIRKSRRLR